jgi:hypothetical protein
LAGTGSRCVFIRLDFIFYDFHLAGIVRLFRDHASLNSFVPLRQLTVGEVFGEEIRQNERPEGPLTDSSCLMTGIRVVGMHRLGI